MKIWKMMGKIKKDVDKLLLVLIIKEKGEKKLGKTLLKLNFLQLYESKVVYHSQF